MASIYHGNAKTTVKIREEIRDSKESVAKLAARLNLNPKTVQKWRKAGRVEDKKSGATEPHSRSLTELEEKTVCEFRRQTKLSLDDVYISLKDKIPALTRSNLHRCLKRQGLNRLPKDENEKKEKKKFKEYPPGFVHVDITEAHTEQGKLYMFVGIDRATKYVYCELHERMTQEVATSFLQNLHDDCPFKITKLLTDNGAQFTYALLAEHLRPKNKEHPFDALCAKLGIEHRLTKFRHPWTNGQVEITNKMLKNHTTKAFHYESVARLKVHLMTFLLYYNFSKKLKSLKFVSPYDKIVQYYHTNPELFRYNPCHKKVGLNT
jgi:transposase-like protein